LQYVNLCDLHLAKTNKFGFGVEIGNIEAMPSRILLFIALATCCSGCANLSFLPADAMASLSDSSHVEAYRTGTLDAHPGYGGKLDGFAIFQTGDLTPDLVQQLSAVIDDPASFIDSTRTDDFVPTVGYRFYHRVPAGQVSLDVLVDFDRDEVLLVAHDIRQKETFRRLIESDPCRARLLEIARQVFPKEKFSP
jgi:hypothetical protein